MHAFINIVEGRLASLSLSVERYNNSPWFFVLRTDAQSNFCFQWWRSYIIKCQRYNRNEFSDYFFFHLLVTEREAISIFVCKMSSSWSGPRVKLELFISSAMCTNCGMCTTAFLKTVCSGWPSQPARGLLPLGACQAWPGHCHPCCLCQRYLCEWCLRAPTEMEQFWG